MDSRIGQNGKICSLSTNALSISLSRTDLSADRNVISVAFEDPTLVQGAKKALATVQFDNGTRESHRLETQSSGSLLVPIVTPNLQDVLQAFSESRTLTVTTRFGSASFNLDGIATYLPALRECADS